jgi:hypothetical protein
MSQARLCNCRTIAPAPWPLSSCWSISSSRIMAPVGTFAGDLRTEATADVRELEGVMARAGTWLQKYVRGSSQSKTREFSGATF